MMQIGKLVFPAIASCILIATTDGFRDASLPRTAAAALYGLRQASPPTHQMSVKSRVRPIKAASDDNDSEGLGYAVSSGCESFQRRESIRHILAVAGAAVLTSSVGGSSSIALAAEVAVADAKNDFAEYASKKDKFSLQVPTGFKVVSKIGSPMSIGGKGERLFSAIDLTSGTVVTVHRERACEVSEYFSKPDRCSLVLPKDAPLMSEGTLRKDATKLLIRHDDRDNAVLGGSSTLRTVEMFDGGPGGGAAYLVADTVLPTGGTYRDEMGLMKESTITRVVKARVVSQSAEGDDNDVSLLGIWVSAPLDEWQNPAMGFRLNKIMENIQIESGRRSSK